MEQRFVHPAQVPQWDVPQWVPWLINLLKLSPRSQIMLPQPINKFFTPVIKDLIPSEIWKNWFLPLK